MCTAEQLRLALPEQLLCWLALCMRMHVMGSRSCVIQHPAMPNITTRPSQNRLTWKFKNFMFLAAAQASGPKLVSIFSHSWGSSNLAIPQSEAAVVTGGHRGVAQITAMCSSTRDKQHAGGQQSKPQMQLQGFVRCACAARAETGIMQRGQQAACSSLCWDSLGARSP